MNTPVASQPMTADLVARLESEADFAHSLIAEAVGDRRTLLAEREALLREAASALRSSGEAVRCASCGTHEVELSLTCHNSACPQYAQEVTVHEGWKDTTPPTPASAWRPIADWPAGVLNRDATIRTLTEHNAWRRGASAPQTDPVMLGKALDAAIAALSPTQGATHEHP